MKQSVKFVSVYLGVVFGLTASTSAATFIWTGAGTGQNLNRWDRQQNWTGPTQNAPGATDTAEFNSVTAGNSITPTLTVAGSVLGIVFDLTGTTSFNITGVGPLTVGAGDIVDNSSLAQVISTVIAGTAAIRQNGSGTLTLSGVNTYTGGTFINSGVVSIGNNANLGNTSGGITFNGGRLTTTAGITSARLITLSAGGGTFDSGAFNSTLSGVISGVGGLTKAGSGSLTLSGANTYGGATVLSAGTLNANNATAFGSSSSIALNGGTLNLNADVVSSIPASPSAITLGTSTLNQGTSSSQFGALTVAGNAAVNMGASGSLSFTSASYSSGLLTINNWVGPAFDANTVNTGATGSGKIFVTAQPDSTFLSQVQFTGPNTYPQGAQWLSGSNELVPVPEPRVYATAFGVALVGFAIARRRLLASA